MTFSFSDLVLGDVDITVPSSRILPAGKYVARVTKAEIVPKDGNYQAVIQLAEEGGAREIRAYITLHHSNEKAKEIGLRQLKQLAVHGGHPDPDNAPSHGINSFVGLVVGINVEDNTYNGKTRQQVNYFFDPKEVPNTGTAADFEDDSIPF